MVKYLLNSVSATGAGSALNIPASIRAYSFIITGTATVQLEGSLDGVNYHAIGSPQTVSGGKEANHAWLFVRGNVTAYTSGTVTIIVRSL